MNLPTIDGFTIRELVCLEDKDKAERLAVKLVREVREQTAGLYTREIKNLRAFQDSVIKRDELETKPLLMPEISMADKVKLLLAQVEILKLKANGYEWSVHTPDATKQKLEAILLEIESLT